MAFVSILAYTLLGLTSIVLGIKFYCKMVAGVCKSKKRVDGQVAIITGANSGKKTAKSESESPPWFLNSWLTNSFSA